MKRSFVRGRHGLRVARVDQEAGVYQQRTNEYVKVGPKLKQSLELDVA